MWAFREKMKSYDTSPTFWCGTYQDSRFVLLERRCGIKVEMRDKKTDMKPKIETEFYKNFKSVTDNGTVWPVKVWDVKDGENIIYPKKEEIE